MTRAAIPRTRLPALAAERVLYSGRPGFPAGSGVALGFGVAQALLLAVLFWAIWWPAPVGRNGWLFSLAASAVLVGGAVAIGWVLIRRDTALARGVMLAPFVRITVTDRRILWTLPWTDVPLLEIVAARVRGAAVGEADRRGRGNALVFLHADDPIGDMFGNVHIDGLPNVARFVEAARVLP